MTQCTLSVSGLIQKGGMFRMSHLCLTTGKDLEISNIKFPEICYRNAKLTDGDSFKDDLSNRLSGLWGQDTLHS